MARLGTRTSMVVLTGCLLAGAAVAIAVASTALASEYLTRQADQRLRGYASLLARTVTTATPVAGAGPAAFTASVLSGAGLTIQMRGSGGQLVLRAGPGIQPGPVLPVPPATVVAHPGQVATISSGRGAWLVITEPVHYQARHLPFAYGAEDFTIMITSTSRPGVPGTLLIGTDQDGISRAAGRLTLAGLAVGGVLVVLEAGLAALVTGRILARPRNAVVARAQRALGARTRSEREARAVAERISQALYITGVGLRTPLHVIAGAAEYHRAHGPLAPGETDRVMNQVADAAARLDALVDDLLLAARKTRPGPHEPPNPPAPEAPGPRAS